MATARTFRFKAKIYKVGINPCVKVPPRITDKLVAVKGYISVKGTINKHAFHQTLTPVKNDHHRLYVNIPMLKGGSAAVGDTASFTLMQDVKRKATTFAVPKQLAAALKANGVLAPFKALTPSRRNEINKYISRLRSEEALARNIGKVIDQLKGGKPARVP